MKKTMDIIAKVIVILIAIVYSALCVLILGKPGIIGKWAAWWTNEVQAGADEYDETHGTTTVF